jgi:diguanylate cyclase (GGDEF)-like protein/PAS domain S-box-containing protein
MSLPMPNLLELAGVQEVLNALPLPVFIKDSKSRLVMVNTTAEKLLGAPASELLGTLGDSRFSQKKIARFLERDRETFALNQVTRHEDRYWSEELQRHRWFQTLTTPVFDQNGNPQYLFGAIVDISEQKWMQRQADGERGDRVMLEMLASSASLEDLLNAFARNYEVAFVGMKCAISLLDSTRRTLHLTAPPGLDEAFCRAIATMDVGAVGVGSCALSVSTRKETLTGDIAVDPLWARVRDVAAAHGVQACWSIPMVSTKGRVLGTFAVYGTRTGTPDADELLAIKRSAYVVALTVEHAQSEILLNHGQESLRQQALHTQTILDNMADGVITVDENCIIQSFSKAAVTIFGYSAQEAIGQHVQILVPHVQRERQIEHLQRYLSASTSRTSEVPREVEGLRKDGSAFVMHLSVSRISSNGHPTVIGIVRDLTLRRKDADEIRRLAFFDPLTELPNRRLLMDRLRQAISTSARTQQHGALMFLDLDHFKILNDTLGHDVGDLLLVQVASRIKTCVRDTDSVARLGGDEFVVLLEGLSENGGEAPPQAMNVAAKILSALGQPYGLREHTYMSTPSIGIVVFNEEDAKLDDLLKKADVAMYQAKSAGRNTIRFFEPAMQAALETRSELQRDMRRGLTQQDFVLYYQIQVNAQGTTIGAEALIRWNHATRGMVSPLHFIPLAEETGMILSLGQWVLETACAQLVAWEQEPLARNWTIAVNVSASQFAHASFVETVANALRSTGANPHLLKLELTESMLVDNVEDIIEKMIALKAFGVGFSLDDFGTGYSSLSYLKRLPLDQLKIDQSFVRDVLVDASDAVIARTVVALGHSLGLTVIAEGVETAEHRKFLTDIGCDAFQGYHFGRPAPAQDLHYG